MSDSAIFFWLTEKGIADLSAIRKRRKKLKGRKVRKTKRHKAKS